MCTGLSWSERLLASLLFESFLPRTSPSSGGVDLSCKEEVYHGRLFFGLHCLRL